MDHVKICEGISDISDSYSGFIIDQWGTLHNGQTLFPDVIETLTSLKKRGKQIVLLSNSSKQVKDDEKRLTHMGVKPDMYDHIVTSTQVMRQSLKKKDNDSIFSGLGDKCFLLSRNGDTHGIETIEGVTLCDDIEIADFILLTGSDAPDKTMDNYYNDILRIASRRQLKMICANPMKTMTVNGQPQMGSGEIARRYEEVGGVIKYIGKPFPSVFQYALGLFEGLYPSQICVIGDSLPNDIRGAMNLDLDCALIASGIHKGSFSKVQNKADIHKMLAILKKNHGAEPTYFIPRFHWGKPLPDRKNKRKREK